MSEPGTRPHPAPAHPSNEGTTTPTTYRTSERTTT